MKFLTLQIFALSFAFHCIAQPIINNFSPVSGPIGSTVTINGSGFNSSVAGNLVSFGGINARVLSASNNTLAVQVPAGATCKRLSVNNGGLTGESGAAFDVSFPGGGVPLTANSFIPDGSIFTSMSSLVSGMADFNGDGKMDLFNVEGFTQGVAIYINNTVGHNVSFAQPLTLDCSSNYHLSATAGDLDGDGKPDIIITNDGQVEAVSVYRNTSTGSSVSFSASQDFTANNQPGEIAVGDLDGDGKPDLVVTDGPGKVISFFRNTSTPGNISFASRVDINPGNVPASIMIADLDGDGKPDLALTTDAGMGTMRNLSVRGSFLFGALVPWATGLRLVSIKSGDIDGDGKPELVATDFNSNTIVLVKNNSSPGVIGFAAAQIITCFSSTNHVDLNDMDGDGKLDLVSSNILYPNVSVFRNTSTSTAITFDAASDYIIGGTSLSYSAVADMDANGRPDIIGGSRGFLVYTNMVGAAPPVIDTYSPSAGVSGTVVQISGKNFTTTSTVSFGDSSAASFVIDSDTLITAIVGSGSSGPLSVENADAKVSATIPFVYYAPLISDFYPAIGDSGTAVTIYGSNFANIKDVKFGNYSAASFYIDSLGGITAIVGGGGTGSITLVSPNGNASLAGFSFSPPQIFSFSPASGEVGSIITISGKNFVADTARNIVRFGAVRARQISASATQLTVKVPAGASYQPLSVTTNSRRTAFASKPFLVTFPKDDSTITPLSFPLAGTFATQQNPTDVAVGDLDGDGKPDMVVLEPQSSEIGVFLSTSSIGNITFQPRVDYYGSNYALRVLLQDLNGDGRPEIIVLNDGPPNGGYLPSNITVISNNLYPGGGYLGGEITLFTTTGSRSICIADMNGDALPDIVVSNDSTGTISVFPNTTYFGEDPMSFGPSIDFTGPGHPDQVISADMDQDGRPDLIATNRNAQMLTVFRNLSAGGKFALAPGVDQPTTQVPAYITAGDLDGDGLPDLVTGNNANSAAIADLNGDGKADLGFGRNGTGLVSLWQNNYSGSGPLSFTPSVDIPSGSGDTRYFSSDLDGDSKPDLIIANPSQSTVSVFRNTIGDPVIDSLSADTAFKGTLIRITGRNFTGGTNIIFGGVPADSMHVVSNGEIDAIVGPGASGNVIVNTLFGTDSKGGFVFIPQIFPEGDTVFCSGNFVILRSTAASNNQWFKDAVAIAGDTTLLADSAGSYTVETTSNGVTTVSSAQQLIVKTVSVPVITGDGSNIMSSALTGNQWYFNNFQIADTTQIIRPGPVGVYVVTTTQDGCTSDPSQLYFWGGAQAIQLPDDQYIQYFPNPVSNYLFIIQHSNGQPLLFDLAFINDNGQTLMTAQQTQGGIFDVSGLPMGVIYLHIYSNGTNKIDKTVEILKIR